jgi:uncharacterized metal-binding protein YceD (DUF177 family)
MNEHVSEFSRIISVARLAPQGTEEYLEAKPAEREALAKRFAVVDITALKAWLTLTPSSQYAVTMTGKIQATVSQNCVVTLEPLINRIELNIDLVFMPSEERQDSKELDLAEDLENEVEFFSGGKIDIGEVVAQHLGVNIDPYPRKEDAVLPVTEFGTKVEKLHPFAKLAEVVKNKE